MRKIEYIKMYQMEDHHFWFLAKRKFADNVLESYKKEIKKILDIGSGTGGMTKHLKKHGEVTGVEQNKLARFLAKKRGIRLKAGNAQKLKLSQKFDLVTVFDVLYHQDIKDDKTVIQNVAALLKSDGYILITDSAFNFLKSEHDVSVKARKRYHLKEITDILKNNNFKIIKASYIYFSLFPVIFIKRVLLKKFIRGVGSDVGDVPPLLNNFLLKILSIEANILKYISFPFGTSLLVLAKKKNGRNTRK